MDTNKKISFGFNKFVKKSAVIRTQPSEEKKVELVDCLEGQSIKIKNAVEVVKEPLVIPIKDNKKNLLDRVKDAKIKREIVSNKEDSRPDSELTLEEQAAKALINDAKNRLENKPVSNSKVSVLPIKEDKITIDGEAEPTLEDYDNVPISDYGMAMLRGMGWKEGVGIGKNPVKTVAVTAPELRPKGLGLGATKIVKPEEPVCDKDGNALILIRGAYAKIIAGLHKGSYCEVQGLDDEAGRVIVRTSLKGEILTLNEFLIVPVTKQEYTQGAKVLNNAKYEEYKEKSDRNLEEQRKTKSKNVEKDSANDSEEERNYKNKYSRSHLNVSSSQKMERPSDSSDYGKNLSSENEDEKKSKERGNSKKRSDSDDEREKYKDKHESRRSKYKDKQTPSSDSEDKYKKSRDRHRDNSDSEDKHKKSRNRHRDNSDSDDKYKRSKDRHRDNSDSDCGSKKNKSKDKKQKKDRHRDRSRSRKEKQQSDSKKSRRSKDRSPYDSKSRESSKKHKSKSRHRRRSSSSSN